MVGRRRTTGLFSRRCSGWRGPRPDHAVASATAASSFSPLAMICNMGWQEPLQDCATLPSDEKADKDAQKLGHFAVRMDPYLTSLGVFLCVSAGALLALFVSRWLPEHHLAPETRDVVRLGIGVVAATTTLTLGLITASVKGSFDATERDVQQLATHLVLLDGELRSYGPDAEPARKLLSRFTEEIIADAWPAPDSGRGPRVDDEDTLQTLFQVGRSIGELGSEDDEARVRKAELRRTYSSILQDRWKIVIETYSSVNPLMVGVLTLCLTIVFTSFGLFAPRNLMTAATLLVCAASIACAFFLILEMNAPFGGITFVSPEPLQTALAFQRS